MARVARMDGVGSLHHVLLRGIERRAIFHDPVDRLDFVARLGEQLTEGTGSCLAWALMSNHVHLVLRTGLRPLSSVMRRLNGGYARAFNLRHDRCGYLFQDRFRSILVQDDAYLGVLIRYVHLNPVRAGIVRSLEALERYPWTGHAELMGHVATGLIARTEVLSRFGKSHTEARSHLAAWMSAGEPPTLDGEFLPAQASQRNDATGDEGMAATCSLRWEPSGMLEPTVPEIRANQLRNAGWTLEVLIDWVCARLGADPAAVRGGRRNPRESHARAAIATLAMRDLALPLDQIGRATGVSASGAFRAIARGVRIAEEHGLRLDECQAPEKVN